MLGEAPAVECHDATADDVDGDDDVADGVGDLTTARGPLKMPPVEDRAEMVELATGREPKPMVVLG